jgi:LysM repeat protein
MKRFRPVIFLLIILLTGCDSANPTATVTPTHPAATFVPYLTSTPLPSLDIHSMGTSTPLPTPTATPLIHTVGQDELGSSIALRYGVTLAALQAANPGVDLNFLKEGSTLVIPASDASANPAASTPTPESVSVSIPVCYPTADQGAWCFLDVLNSRDLDLGSITAEITVSGANGENVNNAKSALLLDLLPAGTQLPIAIHFDGPFSLPLSASGQILTALPQPAQSSGIVQAVVSNSTQIDPTGLTAKVAGSAALPAGTTGIKEIWVAAAAYDAAGKPVGLRKTVIPVQEDAPPVSFEFPLYSAGSKIDRIVVLAEGHG